MFRNRYMLISSFMFIVAIAMLTGCSDKPAANGSPAAANSQRPAATAESKGEASTPAPVATSKLPSAKPTGQPGQTNVAPAGSPANQSDAVQVVANAKDIAVLVNKKFRLPEGYKPELLVEPNVPFIFKEKLEKRKMRKEAADALEKLFAGAKNNGVALAGVSGYRSEATQTTLFNNYVKKDGEEAAKKYSAKPGFSEHQTGLVMDVSGISGKCAAEDCFAGTKEAKWLVDHAAEYGFIVRYLKGKESITGYQYEPWHIRYVGKDIAGEIADKGITLEEYLNQAIPVTK
jgi:D-alanyl-D-alanine carboxypeptidase